MAIILGALMVHGVQAGPMLMSQHPEIFWGLVASFWIGNVMLLVLNIPMIGVWVRILQVPYSFIYPAVIFLVCIGVFSVHNSVFDVWLVLIVGLVGYLMRLAHLEAAPLLMGFILGPMLEENLRRALILGRGDYTYLVQSPISATVLGIAVLMLLAKGWGAVRKLGPAQGHTRGSDTPECP